VKLSARRDSEPRITPLHCAVFPSSSSFSPRGGGGGETRGGDCGEAGETPASIPHCVHETHLRSFLLAGMPPDLSPLSFFSVRVYMWLRDYSCFDGILFFESPGVNDFCYSFR
jgi:hypothetical protein